MTHDSERAQARGEPVPPRETPWGGAQRVERIAEGIWFVSTASHGGFWLAPYRRAEIPDALVAATILKTAEWFEEDVDWAIPALLFADDMRANPTAGEPDPEATLARARDILGHFKPSALARIDTGESA